MEFVEPGLLAALAGGEVPQSRSFLETEDTLERLKKGALRYSW
jgi:hypothetical protein